MCYFICFMCPLCVLVCMCICICFYAYACAHGHINIKIYVIFLSSMDGPRVHRIIALLGIIFVFVM